MKADQWWFVALLWLLLVLLLVGGAIVLVSSAMAHADCVGCSASAKDLSLTTYFFGGSGILLVAAVVAAALGGRISPRSVVIPSMAAVLVLFGICIVLLQPGVAA
jgi:hypothetical protein